jgi:phage terminase large subunit-like protein
VSLYEQGKVSHARTFPELEQQMLTYIPETSRSSPDRMDALVWALTDLMIENIPLSSGGNIWSF